MTRITLIIIGFLLSINLIAQELPQSMTAAEKQIYPSYLNSVINKGISTPPQASGLRHMGEWEEVDYLCITWRSYPDILAQIVQHAQTECTVLITTTDSNNVKSYLLNAGIIPTNVKFLHKNSNTVWIRDYGANNVYFNDVDSLVLVDWVYNRPRPLDDSHPDAVGTLLNIPVYSTDNSPYDLINTGGNFFSDGFGNAFAEKLVLDENPSHTEAEIDTIVKKFMGINRYHKVDNLPYDGIHHIDMHMKLLDEETLLVGEFPNGVSDGPQIESNLQYIRNNLNSVFGTPYKIVRIPMPPSSGGAYPPSAHYRTYSNGIFVNKTYIYPTFYQSHDTIAQRVLEEALPGYNVVGINCNSMISAGGAIHCISKTIGVRDPLLISHQALGDTIFNATISVDARIQHRTGIDSAWVFYRLKDEASFNKSMMIFSDTINNIWSGSIMAPMGDTTIEYYIKAKAMNNKIQARPITAPSGYWDFRFCNNTSIGDISNVFHSNVFPNPATDQVNISFFLRNTTMVNVGLLDINGNLIRSVYSGRSHAGSNLIKTDIGHLSKGLYLIELEAGGLSEFKKLIVL